MASENQIQLEIVLDDGTIKQAFAKVRKQAEETGNAAGNAFKPAFETGPIINIKNVVDDLNNRISGLTGGFGRLGLAVGAVAASGFALKAAFDLALEGEKIIQINNSFEALARNAGVSAGELRSALATAAAGFVDLEDVLQITNKALGELEIGINDLPLILETARKASLQFGGDVKDNYDSLINAILSGNTRALKSIGLFVDSGKAIDDFAKSNGRSANEISKAGRQQAILNAILEQANTSYSGINLNSVNLTQQTQALSVSFGELKDALAVIAQSTLGSFFQSVARAISSAADSISGLVGDVQTSGEKINESIQSNQIRIQQLTAELEKLNKFETNLNSGAVGFFDFIANASDLSGQTVKDKSAQIQAEITATAQRIAELNKQRAASQKQEKNAPNLFDNTERNKQILENQKAFSSELLKIQNESFKSTQDARLKSAADEQIDQIKRETETRDHLLRLEAIRAQFEGKRGVGSQQINALIEAETARHQAQLQVIEAEGQKRRKDQEEKNSAQVANLQRTFLSGLVNATAQGVALIGQNLASGKGSFDNFVGTVLSIIGDLAINIGQTLIGIGFSIDQLKASLTLLSGAPAIAAGLALVAVGGALKGFAASLGSVTPQAPAIVTSPATPVGGDIGNVPDIVPRSELERQVDTQVQVVIQGDILDSNDSGSRIIALINDAFDKKGVQVRRGVMA